MNTVSSDPTTDLSVHRRDAEVRAIFDHAPIGLAQFDTTGRFLLVNDRLCDILGCTREHALARTFQDLTFPDDLAHCLDLTRRLALGETPSYCVDKRFVRPDGSAVWTRITVTAARRPDKSVKYFIGAAEDLTAQMQATEALRVAEERLRTAMEASGIGTFRFDVRRNALEWADGMNRVFGSAAEVTLEDFFERIHPDDREQVMSAYMRSANEGSDFEEEFRAVWPDGSVHWVHDRGRVFPGVDGRPAYIAGAITDITKVKRLEEALRHNERRLSELLDREHKAREAAEAATSLREQVLGLVAHDLRSPLNTILMAGALLNLKRTPEEQEKQIELIKDCAWGMDRLISDLLDVNRIDAGTFAVRREKTDIEPIIDDVAARFQERAAADGIALLSRVAADLPQIIGDHQRLVQALSNLIANALRFTRVGGRIELAARLEGDWLLLSVQDDGAGIAPENIDSVFERFWQADQTAGGAGLGLAIVKGIAESHGGTVRVESRVAHGSKFTIHLPVIRSP